MTRAPARPYAPRTYPRVWRSCHAGDTSAHEGSAVDALPTVRAGGCEAVAPLSAGDPRERTMRTDKLSRPPCPEAPCSAGRATPRLPPVSSAWRPRPAPLACPCPERDARRVRCRAPRAHWSEVWCAASRSPRRNTASPIAPYVLWRMCRPQNSRAQGAAVPVANNRRVIASASLNVAATWWAPAARSRSPWPRWT